MSYLSSLVFPRAEINLDGPTSPPPAGTVPNLDNPPNGNHIAIPIITTCVVVTAISYVIRFYAKYLAKKVNVADCEFSCYPKVFRFQTRADFWLDLSALAFVR